MLRWLVLIVMGFFCLAQTGIAGAQDSYIQIFRLEPSRETRIVRRPDSRYPYVYLTHWFIFYTKATGGTLRYSSRDLQTDQIEVFAEFAGPEEQREIAFYPLEAVGGDRAFEICAENRDQGGWEQADRVCTTLVFVPQMGCLLRSEGGDGCPTEFPDHGPLYYYRPANLPFESDGSCYHRPQNLMIGQRGQVTPGPANNLRQAPGLNTARTGQVPGGSLFTVVRGPICRDQYWWWEVHYQGTNGWTADGSAEQIWIIPYQETTAGGQSSATTEFYHYSNDWGQSYRIRFNTLTCRIENGSEVVAAELSRLNQWAQTFQNARDRSRSAFWYFVPNDGELERFRLSLQQTLLANSRCVVDQLRYQVADTLMDLSGLGNLTFGFYMQRYPTFIEDVISDIAQGLNRESFLRFRDNADDRQQRRTGRAIAEGSGYLVSIAPSFVERVARESGLR